MVYTTIELSLSIIISLLLFLLLSLLLLLLLLLLLQIYQYHYNDTANDIIVSSTTTTTTTTTSYYTITTTNFTNTTSIIMIFIDREKTVDRNATDICDKIKHVMTRSSMSAGVSINHLGRNEEKKQHKNRLQLGLTIVIYIYE